MFDKVVTLFTQTQTGILAEDMSEIVVYEDTPFAEYIQGTE
jgi:hypothetical protein